MIDAVGVEIFGHLLQSSFPPSVSFLGHFFPVVGGKTPVLTFHGKIIRWCSGLSIQIKEVGLCPGFHTIGTNANRDVTFQNDAVFTGVCADFFQLFVQMVLDEVMDGDVIFHL